MHVNAQTLRRYLNARLYVSAVPSVPMTTADKVTFASQGNAVAQPWQATQKETEAEEGEDKY